MVIGTFPVPILSLPRQVRMRCVHFLLLLVNGLLLAGIDAFSLGASRGMQASLRTSNVMQHVKVTTRLAMSDNEVKITEYQEGDDVDEDGVAAPTAIPDYSNETKEETYKREKLAEIAEKKSKEVFMTRQTGRWECQACGYVYAEAKGYAKMDILPGTPWDQIEKFRCPQCGVGKKYFVEESETVSGFKENMKYGFGGNTLTGGQKSNLIFGGLFVGFLIFMSGEEP